MARGRQIARTAWPKAALVERTSEPLTSFADRLGARFYGADWRADMLDALGRRLPPRVPAGSDADCATFVVNQILSDLGRGSLTAIIPLTVASYTSARATLSDEDMDTATDDEIKYEVARLSEDPLLDDDGAPKLRWFTVMQVYWRETSNPDIDWGGSTITLPSTFLRDHSTKVRRDRPVSESFAVPPSVSGVPICITYPDRALRRVFDYPDAPDDDWLRRYKVYRTEGRLETLAAAWRYLALTARDGVPPSAADLARRMQEYLEAQGMPTSQTSGEVKKRNSGFQEMATVVLQQLKAHDLNSSVLASGDPRRRKPV